MMFLRGLNLSLAALLAAGLFAGAAEADHNKRPRRVIVEDEYYPGPPIIRHVPGLRIFFGDYALTEEEFDELYGNGRRYRDDLDEPEPVKPRRKARDNAEEKAKQKQKTAKPAVKKAPESKSASAGTAKQTDQAKSVAKAAPSSGMSCEKASSVVTGYGFSSVTPSSCSGKVYAFNATRDGKSFAIKLDSGSGELTEVKKLP